jgi:hypothetical protein
MVQIIASKEKSQTTRGGDQDAGPSSTSAKTLPPISKVATPNVNADLVAKRGGDFADTVAAHTDGSQITSAHGMQRQTIEGGPGKDHGLPNSRPSSVSTKTGKALGDQVLDEAAKLHGRARNSF